MRLFDVTFVVAAEQQFKRIPAASYEEAIDKARLLRETERADTSITNDCLGIWVDISGAADKSESRAYADDGEQYEEIRRSDSCVLDLTRETEFSSCSPQREIQADPMRGSLSASTQRTTISE